MKAVIIDDDQKNLKILRKMLEEFCPGITVTGEALNSLTGFEMIKQEKPDIVFLDIEMPYGNAFDLLDRLMPVNFEVIFITAFDEYSLKAFRYSAVDYLLKPVDIEELKAAVQKASEKQLLKTTNDRLSNLLSNLLPRQNNLQKIAIATQEGLVFREPSAYCTGAKPVKTTLISICRAIKKLLLQRIYWNTKNCYRRTCFSGSTIRISST